MNLFSLRQLSFKVYHILPEHVKHPSGSEAPTLPARALHWPPPTRACSPPSTLRGEDIADGVEKTRIKVAANCWEKGRGGMAAGSHCLWISSSFWMDQAKMTHDHPCNRPERTQAIQGDSSRCNILMCNISREPAAQRLPETSAA